MCLALDHTPGRLAVDILLVHVSRATTIDLLDDVQGRIAVGASNVQGRVSSLIRNVDAPGIRLEQKLDQCKICGVMPESNQERAGTVIILDKNIWLPFGKEL